MKRIFITQILFCAITLGINSQVVSETWDHEIEVISETEKFDGIEHSAYSTFVYETAEDEVRKLILEEVKESSNSKVTKKNMIAALEVDIPHIGNDPIGVKAITNSILARNAIKVSFAFFHDSLEINSTNFPESDKAAREVMLEISVMLNRSVVSTQIADVEKEINDSQGDYQSLLKEKERYEKQIADGELKQAELDAHMMKLNANLLGKQHKLEQKKVLGENASADTKDSKKYAKAKKKVMNAEREIQKTEQSKLKVQQEIDQASKSLPLKEQEIKEYEPLLLELEELLAKLNAKHDSII